MTIVKEILSGLFGMFVGDAPMAVAILALVGLSAALINLEHVKPLFGGGILLFGCLAVLVGVTRKAARRRDRTPTDE